MAQAKQGDTVRVHYTGRLKDGTVFDTSSNREPLQFTVGKRQVVPGFEAAVVGMNPGESTTTEIPADQAYGPHHPQMVIAAERSDLPEGLNLDVGQELNIRQEVGGVLTLRVTDLSGSSVTLDANHPLAGQDLTFDIQLIEIV